MLGSLVPQALPSFCATVKTWEWPGDEAICLVYRESVLEICSHHKGIAWSLLYSVCPCRSVCLLLQAALPPLLFAARPSTVILKGGTNADMAPPIDYTLKVCEGMRKGERECGKRVVGRERGGEEGGGEWEEELNLIHYYCRCFNQLLLSLESILIAN